MKTMLREPKETTNYNKQTYFLLLNFDYMFILSRVIPRINFKCIKQNPITRSS